MILDGSCSIANCNTVTTLPAGIWNQCIPFFIYIYISNHPIKLIKWELAIYLHEIPWNYLYISRIWHEKCHGKSATCSPGKSETPGRCCDGVNPGWICWKLMRSRDIYKLKTCFSKKHQGKINVEHMGASWHIYGYEYICKNNMSYIKGPLFGI